MDPELLLQNLGFGGPDPSLLSRLPARFVDTVQRDQALADHFLTMHPEFQQNRDSEALAGKIRVPAETGLPWGYQL